jgi:hypothetical protein
VPALRCALRVRRHSALLTTLASVGCLRRPAAWRAACLNRYQAAPSLVAPGPQSVDRVDGIAGIAARVHLDEGDPLRNVDTHRYAYAFRVPMPSCPRSLLPQAQISLSRRTAIVCPFFGPLPPWNTPRTDPGAHQGRLLGGIAPGVAWGRLSRTRTMRQRRRAPATARRPPVT